GADGPLDVRENAYQDPLNAAFAEALPAYGLPRNPDYNRGDMRGFAPLQQTLRGGRRASAAVAYLKPSLKRPNLKLESGALVERLTIEEGRATGLIYRRGGNLHTVRARREVILAGGAYNSPQLLMLNGIGPAVELAAHGIAPLLDLPAVGRNLQDHPVVLLEYDRLDEGPFMRASRWDRAILNGLAAYLAGKGSATNVPSSGRGFVHLDPESPVPEVQYLFRPISRLARPWFPLIAAQGPNRFGCSIILLHPQSRGSVTLKSPDPAASVRIVPNFLGSENDRRLLRGAIRLGRRILADKAFEKSRGAEILPGDSAVTDEALDRYLE